jgi:predicted ester cyclase
MSEDGIPTEPEALFRYAIEEGLDAENKSVVEDTFAEPVELLQRAEPKSLTPEQLWQSHQVERTAMPGFTHDIQDIWRDEEMVFARYHSKATFENELRLGPDTVFEPTGNTVEAEGIMQARVENGQITGFAGFWDKLDVFQQAGIIPPLEALAD